MISTRTRCCTPAWAAGLVLTLALPAWSATLVVQAGIPCCSAGDHVLGWDDDALSGIDDLDIPEPPAPPTRHLLAGFRLPGASVETLWRRDLRATADFAGDDRETWDLWLTTDAPAAECNVMLTAGSGAWSGLRVILSGAVQDTVVVPAAVSFALSGSALLTLEVVKDTVADEGTSWGWVKSLFR